MSVLFCIDQRRSSPLVQRGPVQSKEQAILDFVQAFLAQLWASRPSEAKPRVSFKMFDAWLE